MKKINKTKIGNINEVNETEHVSIKEEKVVENESDVSILSWLLFW